ncbi:RluA family pseudouridine synthase [Rhodoferax antarcticus]|uniref:RluA family pseudouridine synthase n=1 Tax=Rhodoferax antarcticus TaxID=81479 RepID=UPI0022253101|nr:RluA family pseudouridine synthase [Rhodoferax antarcticus]MCW2313031.1 tRNA pseudouridine32 synthase/23S rRNA pseudouridine746 synthase [Rhodoferax antarcticus]
MSSADTAGFTLVYEDDALLVLDKPANLLSVPGRGSDKQDCLSSRVRKCYSNASIVHRLDMGTSGLMLMARSAAVQRMLNDAFAHRTVLKRYEAVVNGLLEPSVESDNGYWQEISLPIALDWPNRPCRVIDTYQGKPSVTRWQLISVDLAAGTSRLRLEPLTGRSHQLRVHLKAIGHPILGDALYAPTAVAAASARLLLHATELALTHPVNLKPIRWVSPAPF